MDLVTTHRHVKICITNYSSKPHHFVVQTMWEETVRLGINVKYKIWKFHVTWLKGISYSEQFHRNRTRLIDKCALKFMLPVPSILWIRSSDKISMNWRNSFGVFLSCNYCVCVLSQLTATVPEVTGSCPNFLLDCYR